MRLDVDLQASHADHRCNIRKQGCARHWNIPEIQQREFYIGGTEGTEGHIVPTDRTLQVNCEVRISGWSNPYFVTVAHPTEDLTRFNRASLEYGIVDLSQNRKFGYCRGMKRVETRNSGP